MMLRTDEAAYRDEHGFVYTGRPDRVHLPSNLRKWVGARVADQVDRYMRSYARGGALAEHSIWRLCPGCYMMVIFNAAVALAKANGQSLRELGLTMSAAFARLAEGHDEDGLDDIEVILDHE